MSASTGKSTHSSISNSMDSSSSKNFGLVQTFLACGAYIVIGPSLILLNKYILDELQFPFPIFLSMLGVMCSAVVARILAFARLVNIERQAAVEGSLWYRRVLPVGMAHALSLSTGNAIYLLLNVGFIQMLKSFTPVIVMAFLFMAGVEKPTRPVIMSIFVISVGTAATCSFTLELNILGLFVMFVSEAAEAVRLVLTQFLLKNMKFGVIEGLYVLAPASAIWLAAASFFLEYQDMYASNAFSVIFRYPFLFGCASFMGLGVNYLSYLVIQATSSLTMKVLSTIRNIGIIFIGVAAYGEVVTLNQCLGYTVALLGFVGYNAAQMGYWKEVHVPIFSSGISNSSINLNSVASSNGKEKEQDTEDESDNDDANEITADIEMSNVTSSLLGNGT